MKKFIAGFVTALVLTTTIPSFATGVTIKPINVKINDTLINGGAFTFNNVTFVPLRRIGEILKLNVDYDAKTNTAILGTSSNSSSLSIGEKYQKIENELTLLLINTDIGYEEKYEISNEGLKIWNTLKLSEKEKFFNTKIIEMRLRVKDDLYYYRIVNQNGNRIGFGAWNTINKKFNWGEE